MKVFLLVLSSCVVVLSARHFGGEARGDSRSPRRAQAPGRDDTSKLAQGRRSSILRVVSESRHGRPLRPGRHGNAAAQADAGSRVVCYYTNWAQYRPGAGKFLPGNANETASLCTHIHYAFAKIEGGLLKPFEWNDPDHDGHRGNYRLLTDLKKLNPDLKVLLSVGGWNMNSKPFSQMVSSESNRARFISSAKALLREYDFDGLDIDWEYPTQRDAPDPEDRHRFTLLLQETAREFQLGSGREGRGGEGSLLLTAAVGAGAAVVNASYEWSEIHKYLDYAVLMSYDFHGSWDDVTGENSPLYNAPDDPGMSVNASTALWTSLGFPADKLLVGVASYGRSFTLQSEAQSELGDPVTGPGTAHEFTRLAGMASYYEICKVIQDSGVVTQLKLQDVPYVVSGNQWIGYDDVSSFRDKVAFAAEQKLGGVALWSLDFDDFSGEFCGTGTYPLLKALAPAGRV